MCAVSFPFSPANEFNLPGVPYRRLQNGCQHTCVEIFGSVYQGAAPSRLAPSTQGNYSMGAGFVVSVIIAIIFQQNYNENGGYFNQTLTMWIQC